MPPCPACGHGHGPYSYSYRLDRVSLRWRVVAGTFTRIFSTWDHSLRAIRSCCYWSFCGPIKCCQYCCLGCLGLSYFGWHEWYYHPPPVRKFYSSRKRRKRLNIQTMSDLLDEPEQHEPVREINLQQQTMHQNKQPLRRRSASVLSLEVLVEIFSFLPLDNLLDCNWTSLKLLRVSQICYRPLQQPLKECVIQKLHIDLFEPNLQFISANFVFRLVNNASEQQVEAETFERPVNMYNRQKFTHSLPTVGLPSTIPAIERISLLFYRNRNDEQIASNLCVPKFFNNLSPNFFEHHLIHYKTRVYSRVNIKLDDTNKNEETLSSWPSQLFGGKKFAAFHLEVNVHDKYDKFDYKRAKNPPSLCRCEEKAVHKTIIGPTPSFYWLFREEFVKNTPRLLLDFASGIEDVLFGDQRLIAECIRWLNLPLQESTTMTTADNKSNDKELKPDDVNIPFQFSTNFERILHIGSEKSTLNMKQIIKLVRKLVKNFLESHPNEGEEQAYRNWTLIVTTHKDININGKVRNSVRMPAEFCIKHPSRGEMLSLTHCCAFCHLGRSRESRPCNLAKRWFKSCHSVSTVDHAVIPWPDIAQKSFPRWIHSFVLRLHPIGPQFSLETNFHNAYKPNNVIEILPILSVLKCNQNSDKRKKYWTYI